MSTRSFRFFLASLGLAALFWSGCQTTDPPPAETVLWLKLNDTLSRYDLVVVQLLDRQSEAVLQTLWNAPLHSPGKDIPGYPLKSLAGKDFIVRVRGYQALGQLGLETLIYYDGGQKTVLHSPVEPLKPVNGLAKLTPSAGTMSPAFNKDSLIYKVTLPTGITSVTFALQAENPAATITFAGEAVASGTSTKPRAVSDTPDTVAVAVTDMSTGTAATRTYTLIIFPTLPPGLYLASLRPTYGALFPDFVQQTQTYQVNLPLSVDTVAFFATAADTRTMNVTINDKAVFPGAKSEVFHLKIGEVMPIAIIVHRGAETSFYQVTINRASQ